MGGVEEANKGELSYNLLINIVVVVAIHVGILKRCDVGGRHSALASWQEEPLLLGKECDRSGIRLPCACTALIPILILYTKSL